jgi:NhaP-type Na+/H+ or K+/H+ antiporter
VLFTTKKLLLRPFVGATTSAIGGLVFLRAKAGNLTSDLYEGVGPLALAGAANLSATLIGGNGFVSAVVSGLAFGSLIKEQCKFVYEFPKSEGQLLVWATLFLVGAAMVPEAISNLTWSMLILILLSIFWSALPRSSFHCCAPMLWR